MYLEEQVFSGFSKDQNLSACLCCQFLYNKFIDPVDSLSVFWVTALSNLHDFKAAAC